MLTYLSEQLISARLHRHEKIKDSVLTIYIDDSRSAGSGQPSVVARLQERHRRFGVRACDLLLDSVADVILRHVVHVG